MTIQIIFKIMTLHFSIIKIFFIIIFIFLINHYFFVLHYLWHQGNQSLMNYYVFSPQLSIIYKILIKYKNIKIKKKR